MSKPRKIEILQNTPDWLEFRYNHIGASDASSIMGLNPWKSAKQLWQQKTSHEETQINAAMQKGRDLEHVALALFNVEHNLDCKPAVFEHAELDYLSCSLDGWDEETVVAVEIKVPTKENLWFEVWNGKVPAYYNAQMQHTMFVMNLELMFYCVLWEGEIKVLKIDRDQEFIDRMLELEKDFWGCLTLGIEPASTSEDYVLIDDIEFYEIQKNVKEIRASIKEMQSIEKDLCEKLKEFTDGLSCKGFGCRVTKCKDSVKVDYKKFVEDKGVEESELKPYTKTVAGAWRITFEGEKE